MSRIIVPTFEVRVNNSVVEIRAMRVRVLEGRDGFYSQYLLVYKSMHLA